MNNIFVMSYKGVWGVNKEKTDELISLHDTKEEAVKAAKSLAEGRDINVIVLNADGTIENLDDNPIT